MWVVEGTRLQSGSPEGGPGCQRYSAWHTMDVRASVQCSDLGCSCDAARAAIAKSDISLANSLWMLLDTRMQTASYSGVANTCFLCMELFFQTSCHLSLRGDVFLDHFDS